MDSGYWKCYFFVQEGRYLTVREVDGLREEAFPMSGCCGAQCYIAPTRRQQFEEEVNWMWGVQSDFASPFAHSGWVQLLEVREGCTSNSLSSPDYLLQSSEVRLGSWAESDSYWSAEDVLNYGRLELFQQLLW